MALVSRRDLAVVGYQSFPTSAIEQQFDPAWSALAPGSDTGACGTAVMSSVAGAAGERLCTMLERAGVAEIVRIGGDMALPVETDYATPGRLGADRIAAACWCAYRFPRESCAIIGAGTAVTVDYLERGRTFRGGAILPGPSLQLGSLHRSTAALPKVAPEGPSPSVPGRDTRACMLGGVMTGLAGAIERIVEEYRALPGGVDRIVTAGGAWPVLAPLVKLKVAHEPHAVLLGAAAIVVAGTQTR
jgi:type III pantothenate kinase